VAPWLPDWQNDSEDVRLQITATLALPSGPRQLWTAPRTVVPGQSAALPFNFTGWPSNVDATVTCMVTVVSASGVLLKTNSSRLLQRFVPPASGTPGNVVQLDRHRRALLVDGGVFQGNGWYVDGGQFTGPANTSFTTAVDHMAANGYNMVMVYAFEKVAAGHVPTPEELQAFLTHCETAGIKVIFNFMSWWEQYSYCAAVQTKGCDLTQITSDFDEMVKVGARSKSLLGWYMCDDCCSLSDDQVAAQAKYGYPRIKQLDQFHPTIGAVNGGCAARFSDADGNQILVDYNMEENYGTDIQTGHIGSGQKDATGHYTGGDASLRAHPLEFEPVINCPWGESDWEFGPWSPATLKAASWIGAVVGGSASTLFFEWNGALSSAMPGISLTNAAAEVGLEMQSISASLAAPIDGSVLQPTVTVRTTSTTPDVSPPATPAGFVRAAAYREPPSPGTGECVHVVAVNAKPSAATVTFVLAGASNHSTAMQPLLWVSQRNHPEQSAIAVTEIDGFSLFDATIGPTATAIFRLGCEVEARAGNLIPNPDMEALSVPGNVYGWGLSYHDVDRDGRAAVHADTTRPAHGRISLRLVVPTTEPVILPISNAGATPAGCSAGDQGWQFQKAGATYAVSFYARSSSPEMKLEVLSGSWIGSLSNYTGSSFGGKFRLATEWQQISTNVSVTVVETSCFQVRASGAVGQLWVDDFFVQEEKTTHGDARR
jgi:hypothetical protein